MANLYCKYLNSRQKSGSAFDLGKGLQQFASKTGLDKKIARNVNRATKGLRESTGISQKRIKTISDLSESNMELLEANLKRLDKTITIYNYTGFFAATSGALGSLLITLKLHQHFRK